MGFVGILKAPLAAYPPLISQNADSSMYAVSILVLQEKLLSSSSLVLQLAVVTRRILILAAVMA